MGASHFSVAVTYLPCKRQVPLLRWALVAMGTGQGLAFCDSQASRSKRSLNILNN